MPADRPSVRLETLVVGALAIWLGIFSMGFQLLGSRMLGPWFGSSIIVWAFLISTFLLAFSVGSLAGGLMAKRSAGTRERMVWAVIGVTLAGFLLNALAGRELLEWLDARLLPIETSLLLACVGLFLIPVCGLASLTPLMVQRLAAAGQEAGFASGWIYSVSTVGNIAGIMLTAFVLIPLTSVTVMLWVWTAGVAVGMVTLALWLRR